MFTEWELIKSVRDYFKSSKIGDDCALIEGGDKLLITKDLLIEGTHFLLNINPPESIAKRTVASNISDIVASGGKPLYSLIGYGAGEKHSKVREILKEIIKEFKKFGIEVIGGDTVKSDILVISITLIGEPLRYVGRCGAKVGDKIFVSGPLGLSKLGLLKIRKGIKNTRAVEKFLYPEARLDLVEDLSRIKVNSMIDISDGFLQDIEHILEESGVGAEVFADKFPVLDEIRDYFKEKEAMYELLLTSGEEYELLCTAPEGEEEKLKNLGFYSVGRIVSGKGLELKLNGKTFHLNEKGYTHRF